MNYSYLVAGILGLFVAVGFWRGWLREIGMMGGLLVSWLIVTTAGGSFVSAVNRIYLIAAFIVDGGFDARQPTALIQQLRVHPLIDPRHPGFLLGIVFLAMAGASFVLANRFVAAAGNRSAQALGALVGLANGYLTAYLAFHYLAPSAPVHLPLAVSSSDAADVLGRYLPTLLVAGVAVAIGIALLSSRRLGSKTSPRPAAGRSKG